MSNVLIGIIGVILFIGLALAGALILGDDFKSATNESKGAAALGQVQQVAQAITMRNLKLGIATQSNELSTVFIPRFLKVWPVNPVNAAWGPGMIGIDGRTQGDARFVMMTVGNDQGICDAVSFSSTGNAAPDVTSPAVLGNAGCIRPRGAFYNAIITSHPDGRPDTWYYVFARV